MAWRLAGSLIKLREQINEAYPNRSKASDGTIGDAAHAATVSDHNPNGAGVVTAFDITHDPANGVDIDQLSDELAASHDPRIKYLIANSQILIAANGWHWIPYDGDPHTNHLHVSVHGDYDNTNDWSIGPGEAVATITIEAVVALSVATTGKQPSNDEERFYIGKPATQENLDGLITYWAGKSRVRDLEKKASKVSSSSAVDTLEKIKALIEGK